MIRHDPNTLEQADIDGRTALMWAAGKGANGVIQLLLGWSNQETLSDSSKFCRNVSVGLIFFFLIW